MPKETELEKNAKVVRNLRKDERMSFTQIVKDHYYLSAAVKVVRDEETSRVKVSRPAGSGCSIEKEAVGSQFV